jgi:transcription initiation factor TFIIE subunit alpha
VGGVRKKRQEKQKKTRQKAENPVLREIITRIAGEHGCEVIRVLGDGEATDEELAKRANMRVNLVRKILYDLYENRVVSYRRVRDEHSGWYIYYWHIEQDRALEFFNTNKQLLLQKLEARLEYERNSMQFTCENHCPRVSFEVAMEHDIKCPSCGEKLERYDNSHVITVLERQIETLKQQFAS